MEEPGVRRAAERGKRVHMQGNSKHPTVDATDSSTSLGSTGTRRPLCKRARPTIEHSICSTCMRSYEEDEGTGRHVRQGDRQNEVRTNKQICL